MSYAYWKTGRHNLDAAFDLYFRKNPFNGEYTIFAGLEEVVRFVDDYKITQQQIDHLSSVMPTCDPAFFDWLRDVTCKEVRIYALREGTVCFPNVPLIRVEGPLAICQLLETPLLTLVNYASLVCTNAMRFRVAAGDDKQLLEFGLRRAQGPNGAISASRYSYMGGFDGTSNVLAGMLFGIPAKGTHAHSFVTSFVDDDASEFMVRSNVEGSDGRLHQLYPLVSSFKEKLNKIGIGRGANRSELIAFTAYAMAFPDSLVALVDTYDTLKSGAPNFLAVALALNSIGRKPVGVRLDSGDLAYLSRSVRSMFKTVAEEFGIPEFERLQIIASNDLNEPTILALKQQGHEIDTFGVGTHLVTCQAQPALGCVYKLVEVKGVARVKMSQEISKMTIPGRKEAYRLYDANGQPLVDQLCVVGGEVPHANIRTLCCHPFQQQKRAYFSPARVEPLHHLVFEEGKITIEFPTLEEIRTFTRSQIREMRPDHLRAANPTPYKVSMTQELFSFADQIWRREMPIGELSS
eukprot:TRINITY_DN6596_c0_g1_i1.p1 TRINITY_DN6596_c0_g1~~TRINITY_DN6596_c0_g1_i1.p1  ORF type:complete len:578 (+),score=124.46 TRINITY_DN6596_c0_g1_i1:176-1735(+)